MANEEHLNILRQDVQAWDEWRSAMVHNDEVPKGAWEIIKHAGIPFSKIEIGRFALIFTSFDGNICPKCKVKMKHDPNDDRGICPACKASYFYPEMEAERYVSECYTEAWYGVVKELQSLVNKTTVNEIKELILPIEPVTLSEENEQGQKSMSKRSPPQAAGLLGTKPIQTRTIARRRSSPGDAVGCTCGSLPQ
jgi:hypothetical protein